MHQVRDGWGTWTTRNVQLMYLEVKKQIMNYGIRYLGVKKLGKTDVFRSWNATSNFRVIYLEVKILQQAKV